MNLSKRFTRPVAAAAVGAASLLAHATPASACGGLFCSATNPVNQQAERIVFSQDENGRVTAIIEIQYAGPSDKFSWVLPVAGVPDIAVSSQAALDAIQQRSNPQYNLTQIFDCDRSFPGSADSADADAGFAPPSASPGEGPNIQVLASGNAGPYDYEVISLEGAAASMPGQVAVDWLEDNGYDVSGLGSEVLGEYLEAGLNLVAFRLEKGAESGSVRPVRIEYDAEEPVIPIRPTAVAADPDMGVMVWMLGTNRAVPLNFRSLELNEALIDWTTGASNYNEVVIRAADEEGSDGHGFVTERAGTADFYEEVIVQDWVDEAWQSLKVSAPALTPRAFLEQLANNPIAQWDGAFEVLEAHLGVAAATVITDCGLWCLDESALEGVDQAALVTDLDSEVFEPMKQTQELFDAAEYSTRLYTTMSPDEMTKDPTFHYNADLEGVDNIHTAVQTNDCEGNWVIDLPDGSQVRNDGTGNWPIDVNDESMPANTRIVQLSRKGLGEVIVENGPTMSVMDTPTFTGMEVAEAMGTEGVVNPDNLAGADSSSSSGGCSATPGPASTGGLSFALLAMTGALLRRRRRA